MSEDDSLDLGEGAAKYAIGDLVAKGGMGAIVQACDQNIRRDVAMKVLLRPEDASREQLLRFINEAQITGQLEHPGIVPVYELGDDEDGEVYYTMKLVQGTTLKDILEKIGDGDAKTTRRFPLPRLLEVFLKICDTIRFAHSRGVIHRDLKPENIMIGDFGEVLVLDWGIAKSADSVTPSKQVETTLQTLRIEGDVDASMTMQGDIVGTPAYMSPEQAFGQVDKIDARTDIYALGGLLYSMLTLTPPFRDMNVQKMLIAVGANRIEPPEKRAPDSDIPPELSAVAMKAMAKLRSERYQRVSQLAADINLFLDGRAVSAKDDSLIEALVKLWRRNTAVLSVITIATILLVSVTSVLLVNLKKERDDSLRHLKELQVAESARDAKAREGAAATAGAAVKAAESGFIREANVRAAHVRDLDPDGPWLPYVHAVIAKETGKLEAAETLLGEALAIDPNHAPSLGLIALIQVARGDVAAAKAKLTDLDGFTDWKSLVDAGDTLLEAREYADARRAYDKAIPLMNQAAEQDLARVKRQRLTANAWVESAGFYESVRGFGPGKQIAKLKEIFIKIHPPGYRADRFRFETGNDTILSLDFAESGQQLLQPLQGFPLKSLKISRTRVRDLTPLKGMPLESLEAGDIDIDDLSPLAGMPLRRLIVNDTQIHDLKPLEGIGLERLDASSTKVHNLAPLKGMPLSNLRLERTGVKDLSPLEGMPLYTLKVNNTGVFNLRPLTTLSKLRWLNLYGCQGLRDLSPLSQISILRSLNLAANGAMRDLSALKELPLTEVDIGYNKYVTDLTALTDMPLKRLVVPKYAKLNAETKAMIARFEEAGCDVTWR